ncbi:MAG: DUF6220 domain-containing protein [Gaiellaceae bacterium]
MNSIQRGAFALYRYLIALFAAACVVQIFLAGRGVFGIRSSATGKTVDKFFEDQSSLDPHRALGEILGLVAIIMFLAALVVWRDRRLIAWTFGLAVAAEILQHAFAVPTQPWVAGLHPVSGVAILGTAFWLAHDAWRGSRRSPAGTAPA